MSVCDPYEMDKFEQLLRQELEAEEPSVIIARRPCFLLPGIKAAPPLYIDADECKKCRMCMKIGCSAITFEDGHAAIDETLCVGCELCMQMCNFGAIKKS